jgi:hypothetical protein
MVLKAGNSKIKVPVDSVSGKCAFPDSDVATFSVSSHGKMGEGLSYAYYFLRL